MALYKFRIIIIIIIILGALTAFVNLVLSGRCPEEVTPVFFGGRLLALNKKNGGFRPIAIGFTLRRLASKCLG